MTSADGVTYELTLYVSGASDLSARAIAGARHLCETLLQRCHLSVCDIHDDLVAVLPDGVLVTPTLVRHHPLPVRMYAGDVRRTNEVVAALELEGPGGARAVRIETSSVPTATRDRT
jgi:circadian clock protein KaiB